MNYVIIYAQKRAQSYAWIFTNMTAQKKYCIYYIIKKVWFHNNTILFSSIGFTVYRSSGTIHISGRCIITTLPLLMLHLWRKRYAVKYKKIYVIWECTLSALIYNALQCQTSRKYNAHNYSAVHSLCIALVSIVYWSVRPPDKSAYLKLFFHISQPKHSFWYSKESSQWDGSYEHPKHVSTDGIRKYKTCFYRWYKKIQRMLIYYILDISLSSKKGAL